MRDPMRWPGSGRRAIQLLNTDRLQRERRAAVEQRIAAAGKRRKHHQGLDLARHPEKQKPTGKMRARDRVLENDFLTAEEFERRLGQWFKNAAGVMEPGASFYCWGGYANYANYHSALALQGCTSQAVIW
jgi:hypothetical protein